MTKWWAVCAFCGKQWSVEADFAGSANPTMHCPLCSKPVPLHRNEPASLLPIRFEDLSRNIAAIQEITEVRWPSWFQNFSKNSDAIRNGLDLNGMPKRSGPAVIVGAGPSVTKLGHVKLIAKYRKKIPTLFSTDRMLRPLVNAGAAPDIVGTVDGDKKVSKLYRLKQPAKVDAILDVVTTHPDTVKAVKKNLTGKTYWFVHFLDNPMEQRCPYCRRLSMTAAFHFLSGSKLISQASGNVGGLGWHVARWLGCNPIILVGMDYSYLPDTPVEKTMYWPSYVQLAGGDTEQAKACYQKQKNPHFDNEYLLDIVWQTYRAMLIGFIKNTRNVTTVNATGGGALWEDPIVSMSLEDALTKYCA